MRSEQGSAATSDSKAKSDTGLQPSDPKPPTNFVYIVDDEQPIGDVLQVILRRHGFESRFFQDPELACESFRTEISKPALLLTDFLMTPINGLELIARCKAVHPELKTILVSGNTSEDILRHGKGAPDGFLRKPFLPVTLVNLVQRVLQRPVMVAIALVGWRLAPVWS